MSYKQLYFFVEGPDDERYIEKVIKPVLESQYDMIKVIRYAKLPKIVIENFIRTYKNQPSSDYLFLCDMDARGDQSCITKRKEKERNKYGNLINSDKLIVVKEEIESWYLAGITTDNATKFKIKTFADTESITKEEFRQMIPKKFLSSNDFMVEILKEYSLEQAQKVNGTLNYFIKKHIIKD
jgi:hypothetical protein